MFPRHAAGVCLLALVSGPVIGQTAAPVPEKPAAAPRAGSPCALPEADVRWTQRVVDGWEQVSRELRIDPAPLPWIVLFSSSCAWHLNPGAASLPAGEPVAVALSFAG